MTFDMIKKNYDRKLWSKQMVAMAVVKSVITPDEYEVIVGEVYSA